MNKFIKYSLIAIGLNLAFIFLIASPMFFLPGNDSIYWLIWAFFISCISLFIQLIVALANLTVKEKKLKGQAMLLSVGIFVLIGFSFCSGFWG